MNRLARSSRASRTGAAAASVFAAASGVADHLYIYLDATNTASRVILGLYTDAGTRTCQGYPGSRGREFIDARRFAGSESRRAQTSRSSAPTYR